MDSKSVSCYQLKDGADLEGVSPIHGAKYQESIAGFTDMANVFTPLHSDQHSQNIQSSPRVGLFPHVAIGSKRGSLFLSNSRRPSDIHRYFLYLLRIQYSGPQSPSHFSHCI